jgi:hypothetical protein
MLCLALKFLAMILPARFENAPVQMTLITMVMTQMTLDHSLEV